MTDERWSLAGGEALLLLRVVIANGGFEEYWRFHVHREYQRTHATRYREQLDLAA
ncbi:hypothetical protein OG535_40140 [Kitasatospora sp. NBC_00085]|uniref:hypothetical protein n=1 Tax=unclassified Kitasatospora TaxID=2633591 RepID=UPI0032446445